jgi:hypothetical protein
MLGYIREKMAIQESTPRGGTPSKFSQHNVERKMGEG